MQITIPKQYCDRFPTEKIWIAPRDGDERLPCIVQERTFAFMVRWKERDLLFMTPKERNRLVADLDAQIEQDGTAGAYAKLQRATVKPVAMRDGIVTIPESYDSLFENKTPNFELIEAGLKVF